MALASPARIVFRPEAVSRARRAPRAAVFATHAGLVPPTRSPFPRRLVPVRGALPSRRANAVVRSAPTPVAPRASASGAVPPAPRSRPHDERGAAPILSPPAVPQPAQAAKRGALRVALPRDFAPRRGRGGGDEPPRGARASSSSRARRRRLGTASRRARRRGRAGTRRDRPRDVRVRCARLANALGVRFRVRVRPLGRVVRDLVHQAMVPLAVQHRLPPSRPHGRPRVVHERGGQNWAPTPATRFGVRVGVRVRP